MDISEEKEQIEKEKEGRRWEGNKLPDRKINPPKIAEIFPNGREVRSEHMGAAYGPLAYPLYMASCVNYSS